MTNRPGRPARVAEVAAAATAVFAVEVSTSQVERWRTRGFLPGVGLVEDARAAVATARALERHRRFDRVMMQRFLQGEPVDLNRVRYDVRTVAAQWLNDMADPDAVTECALAAARNLSRTPAGRFTKHLTRHGERRDGLVELMANFAGHRTATSPHPLATVLRADVVTNPPVLGVVARTYRLPAMVAMMGPPGPPGRGGLSDEELCAARDRLRKVFVLIAVGVRQTRIGRVMLAPSVVADPLARVVDWVDPMCLMVTLLAAAQIARDLPDFDPGLDDAVATVVQR